MAGKRRLWDELRSLKEEFEVGEWCVGGDFNAVLTRDERRGALNSFSSLEMREFKAFKDHMELIDVPVLGKKFT